jgi:integrase/recombinase XerD
MQIVEWWRYPRVAQHPAARAFIESCAKRQQRPKTLDAYARNLDDLLGTFGDAEPGRVLEADAFDIDTYIDVLHNRAPRRRSGKVTPIAGRTLSDSTIRQRIVAARLFYDFCIRRGLRADTTNPVPRGHRGRDGQRPERGPIPHHRRLPWTPPDDVWADIVRHVLAHESKRNAAMVILAYDCALRREEVMSLRLDDIDWTRRLVTVRAETSKAGRPRTVPFSTFTELLLTRYIHTDRHHIIGGFGGDEAGPLFLSESNRNPGEPVRIGTFNDVIEKVRRVLTLPQLSPHTLRHQRCTVLKRGGVDLLDIALFAGHASVATTQLYVHLAPADLSARVRAATRPFDDRMDRLVAEALCGPQ